MKQKDLTKSDEVTYEGFWENTIYGQSMIGVGTMSLTLLFILVICTLQVVATIVYVKLYRKWITNMNGMLIAMSLGMSVGILIGTILGVIFHGDLFVSTFYSILIGLSIGFIAVIPLGLPAVIDGLLSGLMGGMMGAMLGDMVAMTRPNTIINIMAYIITMILLLVLYTVEDSIRKQGNHTIVSFFKHPFLLLFAITLLFVVFNYIGPLDFSVPTKLGH
ncbi:hypothetical protein GLV94_07630 [Virgibacillus halodenitrificans]|uniref:hypothetical protein n=1 Tax=Virgibacillus halodenitrificans TaxID=1482 RepID=UPI00137099CB|nr:hypothetical protein [Virgibacillus halodenitrificans]MYL45513.1 hypothetical protein [Virgibacillus halodenitrificans]